MQFYDTIQLQKNAEGIEKVVIHPDETKVNMILFRF